MISSEALETDGLISYQGVLSLAAPMDTRLIYRLIPAVPEDIVVGPVWPGGNE